MERKKSVIVALDEPLVIDGKQIEQLEMRRPKVKDQLRVEQSGEGPAALEVALFAILCNINPEDLGELDMQDYRKLQDAYTGFLA